MENYQTIDTRRAESAAINGFMTKVYGWMGLALLITAAAAWFVASSPAAIEAILFNKGIFYGLLISELLLVVVISAAINKLSVTAAAALFILYSLLTGLTFSVIFLVFTMESIATTFLITAGTFGIMSIAGMVTKKDLSGFGKILIMGLLGLIIATVVNLFWASSSLYWITTYAGVLIFTGLTAYDTQKLKKLSTKITDNETASKMAIYGALTLYLDLVNLFLYLLRLFGKKR